MIASLLLSVAIVAHDPGYSTSLASHTKRWLQTENVASRIITPKEMTTVLPQEKIAFLIGFSSDPTPTEMSAIRAFRARGGKLVVFYSSSPKLADLMGVKCAGYAASPYPGAWSRMDFVGKNPSGIPVTIRQSSTVLMRIRPIPGKSRILATWTDRVGKSTGEPAWIESRAGYWMSHVLLADGDEDRKAQLVAAFVGSVEPKLWILKSHLARKALRHQRTTELARKQSPRKGEIHAVWDHTGQGLYPGNWPKTFRVLKDAHVTDLYVNIAGAGFAHYPSRILPHSKICIQEGDQLAKCLTAAKDSGIRVHAWVLCFSATRASAGQISLLEKKGWLLKNASGKTTEYLNPSLPQVRQYLLSAIDEIQRNYGVAGIHLDFVRWGEGTLRPKNAATYVTQFVSEVRFRVRRPKWITAAVYGKHPQCVESVGQNWPEWIDRNFVDYVVPMDYTDSPQKLDELLRQQAARKGHAARTIVGLGVTANESRLDAVGVINQINLTRRYAFAGNSLFDLDTYLETGILPYLKLGIW